MPWGAFSIIAVITLVLQTTVVRLLGIEGVDLFLALALFLGLTASTSDARLAAWCAGFVQDLAGGGPIGLHALALGTSVWLLTTLRDVVNLQVWWARWVVGALGALPAQVLVVAYLHYGLGTRLSVVWTALSIVVTSLLAGLLATLLTQLPIFLEWDRRRRRYHRARW
ncbi:MAG: hypothetical protein JNG88_08905 [Phycisphaerales bacterium]|nr:hypothetical protein [Phycisphaerales bacterium]